jgi:LAS superfamily LD-carboxypeptidase LdcB
MIQRALSYKTAIVVGLLFICLIVLLTWRFEASYARAQQKIVEYEKLLDLSRETYEEKIESLHAVIADSDKKYNELVETLQREQAKNNLFAEQVKSITESIGVIEKLARTDPQLLQKYSKVYFLNEHYAPEALSEINSQYLAQNEKGAVIHAKVGPFLELLLKAAEADGIQLKIASAYRSFHEQSALKSAYKVTYGSGANAFSADQGYSEHQLGTTVDFTSPEIGYGLSGFQKTAAYAWLLENAHTYGFVLSYPPNNAYYSFEPWHWRFVGVELAKRLATEKRYFYDLDQRDIDQYIVNLFN